MIARSHVRTTLTGGVMQLPTWSLYQGGTEFTLTATIIRALKSAVHFWCHEEIMVQRTNKAHQNSTIRFGEVIYPFKKRRRKTSLSVGNLRYHPGLPGGRTPLRQPSHLPRRRSHVVPMVSQDTKYKIQNATDHEMSFVGLPGVVLKARNALYTVNISYSSNTFLQMTNSI
jgi:hypothetical protein